MIATVWTLARHLTHHPGCNPWWFLNIEDARNSNLKLPMSSETPSPSNPHRSNEATYVWSRINPRHNRLLSDKVRIATRDACQEIEKESNEIRFANRLSLNRAGVDMQLLRMWSQ